MKPDLRAVVKIYAEYPLWTSLVYKL